MQLISICCHGATSLGYVTSLGCGAQEPYRFGAVSGTQHSSITQSHCYVN